MPATKARMQEIARRMIVPQRQFSSTGAGWETPTLAHFISRTRKSTAESSAVDRRPTIDNPPKRELLDDQSDKCIGKDRESSPARKVTGGGARWAGRTDRGGRNGSAGTTLQWMVSALRSRSRDYAVSNVFGLWTSRLHVRFVASIAGGIKWPYPGNAR